MADEIIDGFKEDAAAKSAAATQASNEHESVVAFLTAAAQAKTREVLEAQPSLLNDFLKAHQADVDSFRFECRRWGDFLALMVERGGTKVMRALHMGDGGVELVMGHAPDQAGEVHFLYGVEGEALMRRPFGSRLRWPRQGKLVVRPVSPVAHPAVARIVTPDEVTLGADCYFHDLDIPFAVPHGARPAEDDRLRFSRSGATLPVPSGFGEPVYANILAELARGSAAA